MIGQGKHTDPSRATKRVLSESLNNFLLLSNVLHREPLVVNPRDHINDDEYDAINHQFEEARGANMDLGPPMYIIAPYDKTGIDDEETQNAVQVAKDSSWHPSVSSPEWVVLTRAVALAKRSYAFMSRCLVNFDESAWSAVFHESAGAFKSYNVLFRVNSDFIVDPDSSSTGGNLDICANDDGILESAYTRSMKTRVLGPKALRRRLYRNLRAGTENGVLSTWQPVQSVVSSLRDLFGQYALFFYNELSPEVIGLVWRPQTYSPMPFSVMTSDYAQPTEEENWKPDSLVMRNASDLLREMKQYNQDVCTTVKIFDTSYMVHRSKKRRLSQDRSHDIDDEESSVSE